jgi:nuclear pore complex protein Nup54
MSLFGNPKPFGTGFGSSLGTNTQAQPTTGLFGQSTQNNTQQSSIFGASNQASKPLFGATNSTPFGQTVSQPQQQSTGLFSQNAQQQPQQGGGIFGQQNTFGQSQQQTGLGQSQQQQPQQSQPLGQTLKFGQSTAQGQDMSQSQIWHEGMGMSFFRTVPAQMSIIHDKWNFNNRASPLRHYLYNNVDKEEEAVMYQPGPDEDPQKWEEAVDKRPTPTSVPVMVKGFWELGKRAQLQRQGTANCNLRLREINDSLDAQLQRHSQSFTPRIAECRRRHTVTRQRTLALAAKIQILRNRGYVMDNAEEELKEKLLKLEREVFDPSLTGREQEIWARMLGIRERGKRLKAQMEKVTPVANGDEPVLDEETVQTAKKVMILTRGVPV